ncbi:hypothetical protein [uncultured Bacteroides sp.]|uniref:hypothetical protein n=1 Tax=uncultured Bacteroides sp. TaxID=162156 RepID=UPI0026073073|nr:hypothetical protein [uncultured Bacteroides sp.]
MRIEKNRDQRSKACREKSADIPVHSLPGFSFLCACKLKRNSTIMAGTTKDMSLIKQVLQLKQAGESNRGVSRKLPIDKENRQQLCEYSKS